MKNEAKAKLQEPIFSALKVAPHLKRARTEINNAFFEDFDLESLVIDLSDGHKLNFYEVQDWLLAALSHYEKIRQLN